MYEITCTECGGVFVLCDHLIQRHEPVGYAGLYHLDGRPVQPEDIIRCDSCGSNKQPMDTMCPWIHPELWRKRSKEMFAPSPHVEPAHVELIRRGWPALANV